MLTGMTFTHPLVFGRLVRRYKRFLVDVTLDDGSTVTGTCPNTGSMQSCVTPGWRVALTHAPSPTRKYAYTWELVHNGKTWIGINTQRTNRLAEEAIVAGRIPELAGYEDVLREQSYGNNSRIDLLLGAGERRCYVEVKNVTLRTDDGSAAFPDAVTERGRKHLEELARMVRVGHRAVMLYVIQRGDVTGFRIAHEIDPAYARALRHARKHGVEALVYGVSVSPRRLRVARPVAFPGRSPA
jgi:sugar fermentation stimulation protein A